MIIIENLVFLISPIMIRFPGTNYIVKDEKKKGRYTPPEALDNISQLQLNMIRN